MTRVGLFADSHGDCGSIWRLMEQMGYLDAVCFMGDVAPDAAYLRDVLSAMPNEPPLYAVRGNNDPVSVLPDELLIELGGKRVYMTHGHRCAGALGLVYRAQEHGAEIALFGHTHEPVCEEENGVLLVNPGSAGRYCRGGRPRAKLMEIDRGQVRIRDILL